ncbi:hypothetical protein EVAR_5470_1 [Eumeta japonica]|uniref:Uncharacterized protein n=1 Tax=Eumeta variegata TaxID=151549 RepID=A0A4C1T8Q8_EUMVA|nr:hypothetical protein EVAR_5470_1 [Eumeta japonica]
MYYVVSIDHEEKKIRPMRVRLRAVKSCVVVLSALEENRGNANFRVHLGVQLAMAARPQGNNERIDIGGKKGRDAACIVMRQHPPLAAPPRPPRRT